MVDFGAVAGFDSAVTTAVRHVSSPALTRVFWIATLVGDASVMTGISVAAVVLLLAWGSRRSAVVLGALMALDPLVSVWLKTAFARPRPPVAGMLINVPTGASFPSGHAMASLLCFGLLALFALRGSGPAWRKAVAVVGSLVGVLGVALSRIYLGVHWPSDTVGAWAFAGVLIAMGWVALVVWERARGPESRPDLTPRRRRRLAELAVVCGVVVLALLMRQAGIDPLIR